MLVISRKTEEFIQIGDNIVVKVIRSTNGSVKLGIEAPGNLRVLRGELQDESATLPKRLTLLRRKMTTKMNTELTDLDAKQIAEAV